MWVLIIISNLTGGSVITQEFTSMLKCQTAQQMLKDATVNHAYNWRPLAICVEK